MARRNRSYVMVFLMLFHGVLLISPIMYVIGFRALIVIPLTLLALLFIAVFHERRIPKWALILVTAAISSACVAGMYWESWRVALFPAFLAVSTLTVAMATNEERRQAVVAAGWILGVVLVGAWLSFIGALAGIPPIGEFTSATGRSLTVYFSSLTPISIGNFMRPSGIYDEPGALSMVVCITAFLRHSLGLSKSFTWVLLGLGLVTVSLAHLVYVFFHFMSERRILLAWSNLAVFAACGFLVLSATGVWEYFDTRLLQRMVVSANSERIIRGDNRSAKMVNAYEAITSGETGVLLFGIDKACMEGTGECERNHALMGQNPISPLAHYGILVAWPYYLVLAAAVGLGMLRRSWWPLLGAGLLFMQRPSALSAGYSMLAALVLIAILRDPLFMRYDWQGMLRKRSWLRGLAAMRI